MRSPDTLSSAELETATPTERHREMRSQPTRFLPWLPVLIGLAIITFPGAASNPLFELIALIAGVPIIGFGFFLLGTTPNATRVRNKL